MLGFKVRAAHVAFALCTASLAVVATAQLAPAGSNEKIPNMPILNSCLPCHGAHGEGDAQAAVVVPRLAGQSSEYLRKQLKDFREGRRASTIMEAIAGALSVQDEKAIADYFGNLKPDFSSREQVSGKSASPDLALGARLATLGQWDAHIPPCGSCHAPKGVGVAPDFPYLAGQSAAYIKAQIVSWQNGQRRNDPMGMMQAIAFSLDDGQLAAVAAYYQSLPPPIRQGTP